MDNDPHNQHQTHPIPPPPPTQPSMPMTTPFTQSLLTKTGASIMSLNTVTTPPLSPAFSMSPLAPAVSVSSSSSVVQPRLAMPKKGRPRKIKSLENETNESGFNTLMLPNPKKGRRTAAKRAELRINRFEQEDEDADSNGGSSSTGVQAAANKTRDPEPTPIVSTSITTWKSTSKRKRPSKREEAPRRQRQQQQPQQQQQQQQPTNVTTYEDTVCFLCGIVLHGNSDEINAHVDACLMAREMAENNRKNEPNTDIADEEDDGLEEYTWAGQNRVRLTTSFAGNYAANGWSVHKRTDPDVDEEIDIDEDDTAQFGDMQYSEADMKRFIQNNAWTIESGGNGSGSGSGSGPCRHRQGDDLVKEEPLEDGEEAAATLANMANTIAEPSDALVIQSLKTRIKDLETSAQSIPKCLVCLDPYNTPLVSIVCWHVHCEACWLRTLSMKRLCPQCQKIVAPTDLRRIYL